MSKSLTFFEFFILQQPQHTRSKTLFILSNESDSKDQCLIAWNISDTFLAISAKHNTKDKNCNDNNQPSLRFVMCAQIVDANFHHRGSHMQLHETN